MARLYRWMVSIALALTASGQTFEVASVKPASGQTRPNVRVDAARVDIESLSLGDLIRTAYRLKHYELVCPDWLDTLKFDVQGKIPAGGSSSQMPEMLQALLAARFQLQAHRASREMPVYALAIGKNGAKLQEAAPDAGGAGDGAPVSGGFEHSVPPPPSVGPVGSGKPMTTSGPGGTMRQTMDANGRLHLEIDKTTLAHFVDFLAAFADRPVLDMTGLKGNYSIQLDLSMGEMRNMAGPEPADAASEPSGGSIFAAVQKLGLKLEGRKAPVEVLVVDHVERGPVPN